MSVPRFLWRFLCYDPEFPHHQVSRIDAAVVRIKLSDNKLQQPVRMGFIFKCTSLGESRSSIVPAVSLEHATSERATMQPLRSGSVITPLVISEILEDARSGRFPPLHRAVCKFPKYYLFMCRGSEQNTLALIYRMS